MKVTNDFGTFYFKEPGQWVDSYGTPDYDMLHNWTGPAIIWSDGSKEYWLDGKRLTKDDFES